MYAITSNKHLLIVGFVSTNKDNLKSEEMNKIKESFKMKEKFINWELVGTIVIVGIGVVLRFLKKGKVSE